MFFPPYTRPDPTMLDMLADLLLLGAGVGVALFTIIYATVFRWHKTPTGIAILSFTLGLTLVLCLVLVNRLLGGDYEGRDIVRVIVYGTNFIAAWGMVLLLLRGRHKGEPPLGLVERPRRSADVDVDANGAPKQPRERGGSE